MNWDELELRSNSSCYSALPRIGFSLTYQRSTKGAGVDWRDKAAQPKQNQPKAAVPQETYYGLLGIHPTASVQEIRSAYRELSKRYHPDTTELAADVATAKFQQLNQAYAVLSSPERRLLYDQSIGYSRIAVVQAPSDLNKTTVWGKRYASSSAYLDPTDRPLSPGEIFALFILGLTVLGCLVLAIAIGLTRGDASFQSGSLQPQAAPAITVTNPKQAPVHKSALIVKPNPSANRPQPVSPAVAPAKPAQSTVQPMGQLTVQPMGQSTGQPAVQPVVQSSAPTLEPPVTAPQPEAAIAKPAHTAVDKPAVVVNEATGSSVNPVSPVTPSAETTVNAAIAAPAPSQSSTQPPT